MCFHHAKSLPKSVLSSWSLQVPEHNHQLCITTWPLPDSQAVEVSTTDAGPTPPTAVFGMQITIRHFQTKKKSMINGYPDALLLRSSGLILSGEDVSHQFRGSFPSILHNFCVADVFEIFFHKKCQLNENYQFAKQNLPAISRVHLLYTLFFH